MKITAPGQFAVVLEGRSYEIVMQPAGKACAILSELYHSQAKSIYALADATCEEAEDALNTISWLEEFNLVERAEDDGEWLITKFGDQLMKSLFVT